MSLLRTGKSQELKKKDLTSSPQGPLEPDSKNIDQLIKTAVVNLLR